MKKHPCDSKIVNIPNINPHYCWSISPLLVKFNSPRLCQIPHPILVSIPLYCWLISPLFTVGYSPLLRLIIVVSIIPNYCWVNSLFLFATAFFVLSNSDGGSSSSATSTQTTSTTSTSTSQTSLSDLAQLFGGFKG